MGSHFLPMPNRLPARRRNNHGSTLTLPSARAMRYRHSFPGRDAAGVLAGVFELARQVFAGSRRGDALGVAANGAGILRATGNGPARPAGKIVGDAFWAWPGVYV